jgi:hypothetical protein
MNLDFCARHVAIELPFDVIRRDRQPISAQSEREFLGIIGSQLTP